jgi:hypothetical protein
LSNWWLSEVEAPVEEKYFYSIRPVFLKQKALPAKKAERAFY